MLEDDLYDDWFKDPYLELTYEFEIFNLGDDDPIDLNLLRIWGNENAVLDITVTQVDTAVQVHPGIHLRYLPCEFGEWAWCICFQGPVDTSVPIFKRLIEFANKCVDLLPEEM